MIEYNKYFSNQRAIFLNDIKYSLISVEFKPIKNIEFKTIDSIETEIVDVNKLRMIFTRKIFFIPKSLYELTVSFGLILNFTEEALNIPNYKVLDYQKYFIENNLYINDLISRISLQISQITASHGQPPVITPPLYIKS